MRTSSPPLRTIGFTCTCTNGSVTVTSFSPLSTLRVLSPSSARTNRVVGPKTKHLTGSHGDSTARKKNKNNGRNYTYDNDERRRVFIRNAGSCGRRYCTRRYYNVYLCVVVSLEVCYLYNVDATCGARNFADSRGYWRMCRVATFSRSLE